MKQFSQGKKNRKGESVLTAQYTFLSAILWWRHLRLMLKVHKSRFSVHMLKSASQSFISSKLTHWHRMKNNNHVFRQAGRTEDRVERCTVVTVSTQRTDFTLAAAPLAAGIGQSHHDISSLPVRTPQRLQHVLWDYGASWAAVSICQRCHIPSAISPHLGLGWILLVAKLWEGICGPGVEGLFSNKSFYNSSVKLVSCMVVCCSK